MPKDRIRRRPVGRPTAETTQELESALLSAGTKLFLEKGFGRTSMRDVADKAAASRQSLYARFPNKTALFEALIKKRTEELLCAVSEIFHSEQDLATTLHKLGLQMTRTFINSDLQRLHQIVISEAIAFPELAKTFYELGPGRGRRLLTIYLTQENKRGTLVIDDIDFAAEQFMGSLLGPIIFRSTLGLPPVLSSKANVEKWVNQAVRAFLSTYSNSSR